MDNKTSSKVYKAVFLDWDQTLGDWAGAETQALKDLYEQHHLGEWFGSFEEYDAAYAVHNRALWEAYELQTVTRDFLHRDRFLHPILQALGMTQAPKALIDLADKMGDEFLTLTNRYFSLLPGAEETVKYLAAKYPLTILSNGFSEVCWC